MNSLTKTIKNWFHYRYEMWRARRLYNAARRDPQWNPMNAINYALEEVSGMEVNEWLTAWREGYEDENFNNWLTRKNLR